MIDISDSLQIFYKVSSNIDRWEPLKNGKAGYVWLWVIFKCPEGSDKMLWIYELDFRPDWSNNWAKLNETYCGDRIVINGTLDYGRIFCQKQRDIGSLYFHVPEYITNGIHKIYLRMYFELWGSGWGEDENRTIGYAEKNISVYIHSPYGKALPPPGEGINWLVVILGVGIVVVAVAVVVVFIRRNR